MVFELLERFSRFQISGTDIWVEGHVENTLQRLFYLHGLKKNVKFGGMNVVNAFSEALLLLKRSSADENWSLEQRM